MGFAPSPARLAREAASRLKVAGRVSVASQARRFFKPHERIRFHGVEAPRLRAIAKDLSWQVRGVWTLRDAVECTGRLMRYPVFECRLLGVLLLSRFHGAFEPSLLRDVRSWLLRGYCDNWALTDAISMEIAARVFETFPRHIPVVTQWVRSRSLWLRRAGRRVARAACAKRDMPRHGVRDRHLAAAQSRGSDSQGRRLAAAEKRAGPTPLDWRRSS